MEVWERLVAINNHYKGGEAILEMQREGYISTWKLDQNLVVKFLWRERVCV